MKKSSYILFFISLSLFLGIITFLAIYFTSDYCGVQCEIPPLSTSDEIQSEELANVQLAPKMYTLSNGMKLEVLHTPFEKGETFVRILSLHGFGDESPEKRASDELSIDIAWESGIAGKNSDQISAMLYEQGIELILKVYPFYTKIEASLPSDKIDFFGSLVATFLKSAHVSKEGTEAVKAKIARHIEERTQARKNDFDEMFRKFMFPHEEELHALKLSDLNKLNAEDADAFIHQIGADPKKFLIIVVGDVNAEEVHASFEKQLGGWKSEVKPKETLFNEQSIFKSEKDKKFEFPLQQRGDAVIKIVCPIKSPEDSEAMSTIEFVTYLIEDRLKTLLSNKTGSSLGVDVSYEFPFYPHLSPANISVQLMVDPSEKEEMIQLVLDNMRSLKADGIKLEEVAAVHRYFRQSDEYWRSSNEYWLDILSNYGMWNWSVNKFFDNDPLLKVTPKQVSDVVESLDFNAYSILMGNPK